MNWLRKSLNKIKHAYALYYFVIVLIIFLPSAITIPSLSFRSAIITAIGMDKQDEEVMVSVLTLSEISKSEMRENVKLLQGSGSTLANAFSSIESSIGRKILMGHVGYVVISEDFATQNVAEVINTLIIAGKVSNTVPLLMCEGKAKDVLDNAQKMEASSSYKMREMINNEFNETYTKDISIDSFLKGYYSDIHISTLGYVTLESQLTNAIESSSGQAQGQSQQSSSQEGETSEQKTAISYKTQHAVFLNGKFKYLFTKEQMRGVNWIVESDLQKNLTINGVSEQGLNDASITFTISKHSVTPKVNFLNGKPYVTYEISLTMTPVEIIEANEGARAIKEITLTDELKQKICDVVKSEVAMSLSVMREQKIDVIGIYKLVYNKYRPFMDFLDTLQDREDFLNYVNIGIDVNSFITTN